MGLFVFGDSCTTIGVKTTRSIKVDKKMGSEKNVIVGTPKVQKFVYRYIFVQKFQICKYKLVLASNFQDVLF